MSLTPADYEAFVKKNPLPKFDGKVVQPNEGKDYVYSSYQYAYSSQMDGMLKPLAIVYVANEDDIVKAINYAHKSDIALSVRSGGHQYLGASSCNGLNIQLDMGGYMYDPASLGLPADTPYPFHFLNKREITDADGKKKVLCDIGPAVALETLSKWLMDPATGGESVKIGDHLDKGYFTPFGECRGVHFGGHCQTGGTSSVSPCFGLLCDYIYSITIIMADGDPKTGSVAKKRTILRDTKDPYEADVFYSTIGGSPGNFGVLIGCTIAPRADSDFPESRALLAFYKYDEDSWRKFVNLYSKYCDQGGTSANYSMSVTMMGTSFMGHPDKIDQTMQNDVPDLFFGPKTGSCKTFTQEQRDEMSREWARPIPGLMVNALWCNRNVKPGEKRKTYEEDKEAQAFFAEIKACANGNFIDRLINAGMGEAAKLFQGQHSFDPEDGHTPISQYMRCLAFPLIREWLMPYHQRFFLADSVTQVQDGFPDYVADMTNDVEGINIASVLSGFKAAQQFIPGGPGWVNAPDDKTSVSFRGIDPKTGRPYASGFGAMSVFYNSTETGKAHAQEWVDKVHAKCFGPQGILSKRDMRFIWAPYGSWNMDKHRERYFDTEAKYERVLAAKKKADPFEIFSPNAFCIGASTSKKLLKNITHEVAVAWEMEGVAAKRSREDQESPNRETLARSRSRK